MKKILSLVLVLTMVLSLCACGNDSKNDSDSLDYTSNSNQISNDTTVVTPDTTDSSAIEFELNSNESNANIDESDESNEVVSNNEKIEEPISSEIKTVQGYDALNLDYKMCKIGVKETETSIHHFYLVSVDKSLTYLKGLEEYAEFNDSTKGIYQLSAYVYNTKDNCKVKDNYENIRCSVNVAPSYIETPPLTNTNIEKGPVEDKNKTGVNIEDLSFILTIIDVLDNFGIQRAQYIEENCSMGDMNLPNSPIYSKNSILFIEDDYYSVTDIDFSAKRNETDEMTSVGYSVTLTLLSDESSIDDIVLGDRFELCESLYMEPYVYPEGTTINTNIENISKNEDGFTTVTLFFEASNENSFDEEFLDLIDERILSCEINGKYYHIKTK